MADPTAYTRGYGFEDFQTSSPTAPLPGLQVDGQLDAVAASVLTLVNTVKDVRRSDGALKNLIVTPDSLSATTRALIAGGAIVPRGDWVTATAYVVRDLVSFEGASYVSVVAHTSGVFATDMAAGRWMLIASPYSLSGAVYSEVFSGDGSTVAFSLSQSFTSIDQISVYVQDGSSGYHRMRTDGDSPQVTLTGPTQITFATAPGSGTRNIFIESANQAAAASAAASAASAAAASGSESAAAASASAASGSAVTAGNAATAAGNAQIAAEAAETAAEAAAGKANALPAAPGDGSFLQYSTGSVAYLALTAAATRAALGFLAGLDALWTAADAAAARTAIGAEPADADILKADEDETVTARIKPAIQSVSSSAGAITLDFSANGTTKRTTLTENITSITISGLTDGMTVEWWVTQAAASSYTITGFPTITWSNDGTEPVMPATNNAKLVYQFRLDNTVTVGSAG